MPERMDKLKAALDARGIVHATRNIYAARKQQRRELRKWKRQEVRKAVKIGQQVGLLPVSWFAWLAIKLVVEWYLRRWFFGASK